MPVTMPIKSLAIACALAAAYLSLYALARTNHILVMFDGHRGVHGVYLADLGPVPRSTVVLCAVSRIVFWPLMQAETVVRAT